MRLYHVCQRLKKMQVIRRYQHHLEMVHSSRSIQLHQHCWPHHLLEAYRKEQSCLSLKCCLGTLHCKNCNTRIFKFHFIINISLKYILKQLEWQKIYLESEQSLTTTFFPSTRGNVVPFNEKPLIPIPFLMENRQIAKQIFITYMTIKIQSLTFVFQFIGYQSQLMYKW